MARSKKKNRKLKVILASLVLLLLASGAVYVFVIAKERTGVYEQALEAKRAGDTAKAERLLKDLLEAKPKDDRARGLLIQVLADDGRIDEAEALADYWLKDPKTEPQGLMALSRLALQKMDTRGAVRYARMVADREPAFAQAVIMEVENALGTPTNRERSARAAEALATLSPVPAAQAAAWLHAAETLSDLEALVPEGPRREALAARKNAAVDRAGKALRASRAWKAVVPEARALMAAIELLGDDDDARSRAAEVLEEHIRQKPEAHRERSSLVRHLIRVGEIDRAVPHVRALADGAMVLFLRALSGLAEAGERERVFALLDDVPAAKGPLFDRIRARVLALGDEDERTEALQIYERLMAERPDDHLLRGDALAAMKAGGDADRVLALIEKTSQDSPQALMAVRLERAVLAAERGDAEAAATHLAALAPTAEPRDLLSAFHRMRRAGAEGEAKALEMLDLAVQSDRADTGSLRFLRAALTMGREGNHASGVSWRERALSDLAVLAGEDDLDRTLLTNASTLAAAAGAPELLGRLLGRALVAEGTAGDPLALYLRLTTVTDDGERAAASQGMVASVAAAAASGDWLRGLAKALAEGSTDALRAPAKTWAVSPGAPESTALLLQFRLAARAKDWGEAEAYAGKLREAAPGEPGGTERLGAVLLSAEKLDAVLALHRGTELRPTQRLQRIAALRGLERKEDALSEARVLVKETKGSDDALFVLAQLLEDSDPEAALGTISPVTGKVRVELFRGALLEGRGDEDAAAQIYEDLLRLSGNRDLQAWRRLARVRAAQDRHAAFVLRVTPVIEASREGTARAQLVLLRAIAREGIEDYERALDDYRDVLRVMPTNVIALNNAAWVMADRIVWTSEDRPARLAKARQMADEAVRLAPSTPQVFHTRAKILQRMGKFEEALADFDAAIGLVEGAIAKLEEGAAKEAAAKDLRTRLAGYLIDKAAALVASGDVPAGTALYERVATDYEGSSEARKARAALERMGG